MKKAKLFCTIILSLSYCLALYGQEASKDFEFLVGKIKNDYPGYNDKVKPELAGIENNLRERIESYPDSAFFYFRNYLSFFKDGHLRVERLMPGREDYESTLNKISSYGKIIPFVLPYEPGKDAHFMEGLWTTYWGDMLIIKSPDKENVLLGLSVNYDEWEDGNVMYEFTPTDDVSFNVTMHTVYSDESPETKNASLELNKQVLEIHYMNQCFVRKTRSAEHDNAFLETYQPKRPNGQNHYPLAVCLDDSTFYFRIVTFARNKDYITEQVNNHWQEIISRPNLIIDIRGNYGGHSDSYESLIPLMYTNKFEVKDVEYYASPGNIEDYEQAVKNGDVINGEEGLRWLQSLVDEMKKNVGGYVVHPYSQRSNIISFETVYQNPRKIGIIINNANASAAEQFLLTAKNSTKVILFGNESTAGVLDYSNTNHVTFPSGKYELIYPMSRSLRLPENPIDNTGIAPDVYIPFPATKNLFDRVDDWVYFVKNYLNQ